MLNRGVLWLRKREVFIGFIGKWETRQCIINNNEFHNHCSTWRHFFVLCHSTCLHLFFFSPPLPSHSLPLVFFFSLSTAWLCWHLHSSVFVRKKDERFFPLPVVLSLTHFSPRPVSCVFSPISGILRSPPSMWVTLMCAAGLSCRAGSSTLCNLGVCLWTMSCVCVYFCVCHACNPLGMNSHERS